MLKLENVKCSINDKEILKGVSLKINPGEIHAIMGPNGTGKSTLSHLITGKEDYELTSGSIEFLGKDISDLSVDERAKEGVFLSFQYPVEISGVSSMSFLKSCLNSIRNHKGLDDINPVEFLKLVRQHAKNLEITEEMLKRSVNHGFSGGEKKRFETLQMAVLEPKLCILDETDSGLDIDSLKNVADSINSLRDNNRSFLMITHYQRLLNYVKPDFIHVMNKGRIVASGGFEIAQELEKNGYKSFGISEDAA